MVRVTGAGAAAVPVVGKLVGAIIALMVGCETTKIFFTAGK